MVGGGKESCRQLDTTFIGEFYSGWFIGFRFVEMDCKPQNIVEDISSDTQTY